MRSGVDMAKSFGPLKRSAPTAFIVLAILCALSLTLPKASRQPLMETTLWSLVVIVAFIGWGSLVAFAVAGRERVDLGLRATWGAAAMAFVGGGLMVPSLMTRAAAMNMVVAGAALAIVDTVRQRSAVHRRFAAAWRCARREPRLVLLTGVVLALLVIHYLAGIAEWHTDPYDDDIAYLSFVKKLLQTGSFPEPFSFRRLSALGGQTFFAALVSLRAAPHQAHTFDRSVCILLVTLLLAGHRSRGRRPSFLFSVAAVLVVPMLPLITRNTASHYSAIAFFLALFRTVVWAGDRERSPWKAALPVALVAVVVCTLRQNYLPIPATFLAVSYGARAIHAGSWRERLLEPAWAAAFSVVALAPWLIAAWQSNHTFLYPLMLGTFNRALQLGSDNVTKVEEIRVLIRTVLEGVPIYSIGLFFVGAMFTRENDRRKPLFAFVIASCAGFLLLIHAINQGDPQNLGRYACGFLVAGALATILTTGLVRFHGRARRIHVAAALTLLALVLQLGRSADDSYKFYARALPNIDAALRELPRSKETEKIQQDRYGWVQNAVPEGERIAVLLDEPHWLNFARNPIWNLDMPGYSSLPPGMPFFLGSQKLEEYFLQVGIRYIAFVRPDRSTYHYRRDYWMQLLVDEMEIWRTFAPYVIDMSDNLVEISTRHRRLIEKDGIIVLDLAQSAP